MIADIIDKTVLVFTILIILRALMTWIPNLDPYNPIVQFLVQTTEPILAPIRALMPRGIMLDFTPMIAIILLQLVGHFLVQAVA